MAPTLLREVVFWQLTMALFLASSSFFNKRRILKGETWIVYRTSIVYFFSLNSLRKRVKHEWRQLKVSSIWSILSIFGRENRFSRGMQTCRADYQRDKRPLQLSLTVHKANGIKQLSTTRTPGQSKSSRLHKKCKV